MCSAFPARPTSSTTTTTRSTSTAIAGAPERAIAHGWKPAFLCEVTTAIGLVTLVTSELVPIRKFGLFSALGVMVMFVIMLTYLPAALQIWPQKPRKQAAPASDSPRGATVSCSDFWQPTGRLDHRHHALVAIGCTLVIAGIRLWRDADMKTSVNLLKMFHSEAKIIKDYEWLEANLGQLVPMEVVVRVPPKPISARRRTTCAQLHDELAADETSPARKAEIEQQLARGAVPAAVPRADGTGGPRAER